MIGLPSRGSIKMNDRPTIPQIRGRAGTIEYSKNGRTAIVEWEMLVGTHPLLLYAESIKHWNDGSPVTDEERAAIIEDIRNEIRPKWGEIDVEDPRYR
jgi:hypothetical protein